MNTMKVNKIGVLSLAKLQAALMALFGLIPAFFVLIGLVIMLVVAARQGPGSAGLGWRVLGGLLVIVLAPLFYGLMGFITGALAAFLYNLAAGMIGGLEIELEVAPPVEPLNVTQTP
jgi:hypothetical protein